MKLATLGQSGIVTPDGRIELQPLPMALLAYLAIGGPKDRTHLADLFWQHSGNALNSLSTTLSRIRNEAPGAFWIRGTTLVGSDLETDVSALHEAARNGSLDEIRQLYRAPFLSDLKLRKYSVEFEEWMLDQRSSVAAVVELSLLQRSRELFEGGMLADAADLAEEAWETVSRDGNPSPDYLPGYHRVLAEAGRALASRVRQEAADFGIVLAPIEPARPAPAAVDLREPASTGAGRRLPTRTTTPIFGCENERAALRSSVSTHGLTTVVGLGGSGKTRLVGDLFDADDVRADFDHAHWVSLAAIDDPSRLAPTIAAALGLRLQGDQELVDLLPEQDRVLLVLDNFEQLVDERALVASLVAGRPNLRVVVTSRVPLDTPNENLVALSGLAVTLDNEASPAEQLFRSAALRAGAEPNRVGEDAQLAIREVCARVGGIPLALELAGSWATVLAPADIAEALAVNIELLDAAPVSDERSMDAIIEQSWTALSDDHQQTMMLLAVFPGGCATAAAVAMPDLSMKSVGHLVRHSLVVLDLDGRLGLHPLITGYARNQLTADPDLDSRLRAIQAAQVSTQVVGLSSKLAGSELQSAMETLDDELPNVFGAWSWAAPEQRWEVLDGTHATLRDYFVKSGRVMEGERLFGAAIEALRPHREDQPETFGWLLEARAWLQFLLGKAPAARRTLADALESGGDGLDAMRSNVLRTLGTLHYTAGEVDEASASFTAALELSDESADPRFVAKLNEDLGHCHQFRQEYEKATAAFRATLDLGRELGDPHMVSRSYLTLAEVERWDNPARSVVLLGEGEAIANEHRLEHLAMYFPRERGLAYLAMDDATAAHESFTEGLEASRAVGHVASVVGNHIGRAEASRRLGDLESALEDLTVGVRIASEIEMWPYMMWAAVVSANLIKVRAGKPTVETRRLLALAAEHPSTEPERRAEARAVLADFEDDPSVPTTAVPATARIDEVAEELLEALTFG